jgi:hypothetical protein
VRGSKPRVKQTIDGARVVGRDFAFSLSGTGSAVTNWELIGGMPITPCVLPSSILRNYCQMFQFFKVNKIVAHYITSSATSQTGDILFYYERDRLAPMCDYSNTSFLPYVLSDDATIIGPQWMNHSALIKPPSTWKSTLYGNQSDLNEDAAGTLFFFSKTNTANSPGYLLIDYDISFKSMAVNPRAGTLPIARGQSNFVCFTNYSATLTAASTSVFTMTGGKTVANVNSALPTGYTAGDVYKTVFQITASTQVNAAWTGTGTTPTTANLLTYDDNTTILLDDGFTVYAASPDSGATWVFFATLEQAVVSNSSNTNALESGLSATSATVNVCAEIQLVRNVDSLTQSAY